MRSLLERLQRIAEEQDDIFKAATPDEVQNRKLQKDAALLQELRDEILAKSKKNPDGTYNVNGKIDLSYRKIGSLKGLNLPIHTVVGDFIATSCQLTSLEGAPRVVRGDFNVYGNKLTDLVGGPSYVLGEYDCRDNTLKSLKGLSAKIGGNLLCNRNTDLSDFSALENSVISGTVKISRDTKFNLGSMNYKKLRLRGGVIRERFTNEALKSDVLRFLQPLLAKYSRGTFGSRMSGLKFDQITDDDIEIFNNPLEILKPVSSGKFKDKQLYWILMDITDEKMDNTYASSEMRRITLPHLLAVTLGKEIEDVSQYFKTKSLQAIANTADMVIAISNTKFSTDAIRQDRHAAKTGAVALMDPSLIRQRNKERYGELLKNKRASLDFMPLAKEWLDYTANLAMDVFSGKETMSDYTIIDDNQYASSASVNSVKNPAETMNSLIQSGWKLIQLYTQKAAEADSDEYAKSSLSRYKDQMYKTLEALKDKKISTNFTKKYFY